MLTTPKRLEELILCSCRERILGDVDLLSPPTLLIVITTHSIKYPPDFSLPLAKLLVLFFPYGFTPFQNVVFLNAWMINNFTSTILLMPKILPFWPFCRIFTAFTSSMSKGYMVGLCENWDLEHQMHRRTPGCELQRETITLCDILCQLQDPHLFNMHSQEEPQPGWNREKQKFPVHCQVQSTDMPVS